MTAGDKTAAAAGSPGVPRPLTALVADPRFGPLPALLLVLTAVTGVVDAVSILSLGRVFVANMTGNVVFAGFAIVGAPGFSLSASLFALAGFLIGAALGGLAISRSASDRGTLLRTGAVAEFILAAIALAVAAASGDAGTTHGTLADSAAFTPAVTDALAAVLAIALGIQNAVARKLAVPDLTTTVLTMTLTGLGSDIRALVGGQPTARHAARASFTRRLLAVAVMLAGGVFSAWLVLNVSVLASIILAVALLAITAGSALFATRRPAGWRSPQPKS
ncbi:MAG TPA: YoaK family protein [Trebonia sp.]|jgi:uncharacterized membrane protein YoaK (UPF0700 family)